MSIKLDDCGISVKKFINFICARELNLLNLVLVSKIFIELFEP